MPLQPLPPTQWPIAGPQPPTDEYAQYFASADQLLRSAPGFAGGVATDANGAGHTLTVASLLAGVLLRSGPAGAFSDTTPTAADIVASIPKAVINTSRLIFVANAGGGLMTLLAGTGLTLQGTTTIATNFGRWYLLTVTSLTPGAAAVTLRGLMTGAM